MKQKPKTQRMERIKIIKCELGKRLAVSDVSISLVQLPVAHSERLLERDTAPSGSRIDIIDATC